MVNEIEQAMHKLPPVKGKNAGIACVIGFLFGGIGLAIYFKNIIDLVFPVIALIVVSVWLGGDIGFWGGALFAAAYGYFRVTTSESASV